MVKDMVGRVVGVAVGDDYIRILVSAFLGKGYWEVVIWVHDSY